MEKRGIKVGLDYDGVIINSAYDYHVFKTESKMDRQKSEGIFEGIKILKEEPDVEILGVYTARPQWLRRNQTHHQLKELSIPINTVTHAAFSFKNKIEKLLLNASGFSKDNLSNNEIFCPKEIKQIVLIDDDVSRVITAARKLTKEKPFLRPLMEKFTLVAFNSKQSEEQKGLIIPGIIHVTMMRNWSDIKNMLGEIRKLA